MKWDDRVAVPFYFPPFFLLLEAEVGPRCLVEAANMQAVFFCLLECLFSACEGFPQLMQRLFYRKMLPVCHYVSSRKVVVGIDIVAHVFCLSKLSVAAGRKGVFLLQYRHYATRSSRVDKNRSMGARRHDHCRRCRFFPPHYPHVKHRASTAAGFFGDV